jgi:hypothetical protein
MGHLLPRDLFRVAAATHSHDFIPQPFPWKLLSERASKQHHTLTLFVDCDTLTHNIDTLLCVRACWRSECPLPAPTKQTHRAEAGGEKW